MLKKKLNGRRPGWSGTSLNLLTRARVSVKMFAYQYKTRSGRIVRVAPKARAVLEELNAQIRRAQLRVLKVAEAMRQADQRVLDLCAAEGLPEAAEYGAAHMAFMNGEPGGFERWCAAIDAWQAARAARAAK